jgi:putative Mg2+ transporter-C (MgtC) family protein
MMETDLWILLRLAISALLGGLIGIERGNAGKATGLRTHMLIAISATLFVSFTALFAIAALPLAPGGPAGNFRIQIDPIGSIDAIVTGVSFLGAGIIFVSGKENEVRNMTTAASIWVTAAIGVAVGLERYVLAIGTTLLVLMILRLIPSMDPSSQNEPSAAKAVQ